MKRFFRKKDEASAPEQQKPAATGGLSIAHLNLVALLVAVVVILLSGYAAYLQFAAQVTGRQEDADAAMAGQMAAQLSGRLQAMSDTLERWAQADTPLLTAIAEGDEVVLRTREARLAAVYPEALRIRYILPSEQEPNQALTPRLGYACLDLARQAEAGRTPPFEVHLYGDAEQHLDMVRAVVDGKQAVASLLVTLDVSVVKQWLEAIRPKQGFVELLQGNGEDALQLGAVGDAALKGQGKVHQARVGMSSWQLSYHPVSSLGMAEAQRFGFLATFAIAAGVLAAFYVFFNLFLVGFLRRDLKRMVGYIVDSSLGKQFHSYPVKLVESKRVLHEKEMDLAVLSSHARIKGRQPQGAANAKHEHNPIPDLTFVKGHGMSVEEHHGKAAADEHAQKDKE